MDERAAFEANIDANPLDAQNHLVYSDWLRDQGEEDEADFRRAMGEWHAEGGNTSGGKPGNPEPVKVRFPWTYFDLPNGVYADQIEVGAHADHRHYPGQLIDNNYDPVDAPANPSSALYHAGAYRWATYRDMEQGLRRAFMANRSANSPQKMSRRIAARKFSRRIK